MGTLFAGGEDICFSQVGATSAVNTATTAARRSAYARCSLAAGATGTPVNGDGWLGALSAASSAFWFSAQLYLGNTPNTIAAYKVLAFRSSNVSRLEIRVITAGTGLLGVYKVTSGGTATLLATFSSALGQTTLYKLDIQVNYSTSGFVKVYLSGTLIADTGTVDVTTDGATTLDGFLLGHPYNFARLCHWSEIIAHTDDTRSLSLCTLPPAANGNAYTFDSGSFADIDEVTNSDADIITSGTANQLAQFTVNSSGVTGNPGVKSVAVWARAQRGASGPQNMQLNVRTASTDYVSGNKALALSMAGYQNTWDTNPNTSLAWAYTDLTAAGFNIGVKSIT